MTAASFSHARTTADDNDASDQVRVLLVDDQLIIAEAVRRMLASHPDIAFHYVTDPGAAHAAALALRPTVILQDLVMPGADGFQLIAGYRADERLADVPVAVLSTKEEARLKAHGFAVGANDYLVKLPDQLELVARIRHHSRGYIGLRQRDAALRSLRASQDELARTNLELQKLAALDGLTGIANRRRFDEAIGVEWQRARRQQSPLALLLCDVDRFKNYNDSLGHPAGDLCLKKAAAVLTGQLKRPADLAARYGGEEFAILLPDTDLAGALKLAEDCRRQLAQLALPHPDGIDGVVTMSVGAASVSPATGGSIEALVAAADAALYDAKRGGRNRVAPHA
ncbi:diguanylate cyclase domain-containing protein [Massilia norwichensis]|uniref:diguanylate cyclase n=1 Tax=Massilia norwichensis TaxID=1442366 RepID=A0ABT2ABL2_9BURK|nr:diguanylate cyclase [Massilia norwichensis]MCS0591569.1 diguanylate cyclase [Massilia norwichensis]